MITLEELNEIREKAQEKMNLRQSQNATRVVVGMATCGIAAGARPVMLKFMEEIQKRGLTDVIVSQTGCVGVCRLEPIVDIYRPNEDKVTYVKMTPEKVSRVVAEHIVNGHPVTEYTIGYVEGQSQN
ncbi:MAG: NADP-reducing hydrogenase subunit HndB [Clostridiales bacterium]|nr:NADP-reducing hydrogenase subunit HndB [Clostridiales bacterium]